MQPHWNTWDELDEMLTAMNQLRTYMDRAFSDAYGNGRTFPRLHAGTWPRTNVMDAGANLVVTAEVPGLSDKDIQLSLNQDVLTVSGERQLHAPTGYSTHRQERGAFRFSRSLALPCKVDPDKATATVRNGILTVTLAKAQDAMPRQITVRPEA